MQENHMSKCSGSGLFLSRPSWLAYVCDLYQARAGEWRSLSCLHMLVFPTRSDLCRHNVVLWFGKRLSLEKYTISTPRSLD